MNKAGLIFMALVALGTANADAKKFYHYSPTLAFLCDDETMTAEVSGTYYTESKGTLIIPETIETKDGNTYTVTAIGNNFIYRDECYYSDGLEEVVLPKTIKSIGINAFSNSKLQRINLPEGLESIGDNAFRESKLQRINLPEGLVSIGDWAFYSCKYLELSEFPSTLKHIGRCAFRGCYSISVSSFPDGIETLGAGIFSFITSKNSPLKKFTLPDHLKEVPDSLFLYCSNLEEVHLPANLEKIGSGCFCSTKLKEIVLPETLKEIGERAFYSNTLLTHVTLPKGVTSIPAYAFYNCPFTSLDLLHEGIKEIGDNAFKSCPIEEAIIPDGVVKLGCNAFGENAHLKTISFPKSLTEFGGNPMEHCDSLKNILIAERHPTLQLTPDSMLVCKNSDGLSLLYVHTSTIVDSTFTLPIGTTEIADYAIGRYRVINRLDFPEGLRRIGEGNFRYSALKQAILPSTVEELGSYTFNNSKQLEKVVLPPHLKVIPFNAFYSCENLSEINWPDDLEEIEGWAFCRTNLPSEIVLPSGVHTIAPIAFARNKRAFEKFVLPDGIEVINDETFSDSKLPNGIDIPGSVKIIGSNAFSKCGMKDIVIPEGVEYIGGGAFIGNNLTNLHLPSTLKYLDSQALAYTNIAQVTLPEHLETFGAEVFCGCSNLKELVFPDKVDISPFALSGLDGLEHVVLPDSMPELSTGLFCDCPNLTSVKLPSNLRLIECNSFENCSALEELSFPATLECIGNQAFSGSSLKRVDLSQTALNLIIWEAFANNPHLEEVHLPATCNFVGAKAFAGCDNIRVVEVLATEPPTAEAEAFQSPVTEQAILIVPEGSEAAYRNAEVWKEFKHIATPTGMNSIIVDTKDGVRIYDLRGMEKKAEKGIYIKGGKVRVNK